MTTKGCYTRNPVISSLKEMEETPEISDTMAIFIGEIKNTHMATLSLYIYVDICLYVYLCLPTLLHITPHLSYMVRSQVQYLTRTVEPASGIARSRR